MLNATSAIINMACQHFNLQLCVARDLFIVGITTTAKQETEVQKLRSSYLGVVLSRDEVNVYVVVAKKDDVKFDSVSFPASVHVLQRDSPFLGVRVYYFNLPNLA